jgi:hypothetical protein
MQDCLSAGDSVSAKRTRLQQPEVVAVVVASLQLRIVRDVSLVPAFVDFCSNCIQF